LCICVANAAPPSDKFGLIQAPKYAPSGGIPGGTSCATVVVDALVVGVVVVVPDVDVLPLLHDARRATPTTNVIPRAPARLEATPCVRPDRKGPFAEIVEGTWKV